MIHEHFSVSVGCPLASRLRKGELEADCPNLA